MAATSSTRVRQRAKREAATWKDKLQDRLPGPIRRIVAEARGNDLLLFAGSLAFYAIVSIAPLSILVLWLVGLMVGDQRLHTFATEVGRVTPRRLSLEHLIQQVADVGARAGVAGILTGIWPATAYGSGLQRAFDRLSGRSGEGLKGLRGRALFFVVLIPVFVIGGLVASYAGSQAVGAGALGVGLGLGLALVIGFAAAAAGLVLIYRIFPPTRLPWPSIWRAVLWTAVADAVISVGFVAYLGAGTQVQRHYITSGIATVVLLALWLFAGNIMLLVGYRIGLDTRPRGRRRG